MSNAESIHKPLSYKQVGEREISFTNPEHYPEELHKDLFDELRTPMKDGSTVPLVKLPVKQEQSKYWGEKINIVGFVILFSVIAICGILLQETKAFQMIWSALIGMVGI